jgi:hypothetical protein
MNDPVARLTAAIEKATAPTAGGRWRSALMADMAEAETRAAGV